MRRSVGAWLYTVKRLLTFWPMEFAVAFALGGLLAVFVLEAVAAWELAYK